MGIRDGDHQFWIRCFSNFQECSNGFEKVLQIGRYFSNPRYYFQVNDQYVQNKLKVILFPFWHRVGDYQFLIDHSTISMDLAIICTDWFFETFAGALDESNWDS